jgi:multiple sugar transport system ATP-binding protein
LQPCASWESRRPALRARTRVELAELHQRLGATMIYVTHDQVEAMTLADRIVILNDCRIEQVGTPMQVYSHPASRFVAGFVGSPAMNFLKAELSGSGDRMQVRLADGALLPAPRLALPGGGTALDLGVRPEALTIATGDAAQTTGTVTVVERLGERTLVHVRLKDAVQVTAQDHGLSSAQPGAEVGLKFDTAALHFFDAAGKAVARA